MEEIRIKGLELDGFRNVRHGSFTMPEILYASDPPSSDILAIFGQNGSGKSAAVEALDTLRHIISSQPLPRNTRELVNVDSKEATLSISFRITSKGKILDASYTLRIGTTINGERLSVKESGKRALTIYWDRDKKSFYGKPSGFSDRDAEKEIALSAKERRSMLFASPLLIRKLRGTAIGKAILALREYARTSFLVISSRKAKPKSILTISYLRLVKGRKDKGRMDIDLSEPFQATKEEEENIRDTISNINSVLGTLISNMSIGIREEEDGMIELTSNKNNSPIPLRSESEGIIKLISLLSVLIFVYNERSSCLVIDELDASIYEYLLGELMEVFRNGAEGQLIFTSHNLRILEMIDKRSLIISTRNPDSKYMRIPSSVPDTENLRSYYLRSVLLSDESDGISSEADPHDIARALRKAWRHE